MIAKRAAADDVVRAEARAALEAIKALEKAQRPARVRFNRARSLNALEALMAKEKAAGAYGAAPWVQWILTGPGRPRLEEPPRRWVGTDDNDAGRAKKERLHHVLADLIENGADLAMRDASQLEPQAALALLVECDELTLDQRLELLARALHRGAAPSLRFATPWQYQGVLHHWTLTPSALDVSIAREHSAPVFLERIRSHVGANDMEDAVLVAAIGAGGGAVLSQIGYLREDDPVALDALLVRAGNLDRRSIGGHRVGAFVHFACDPEVHPDVLSRTVGRLNVNAELERDFTVHINSVSNGSPTPTMTARPGATPLDIGDGILRVSKMTRPGLLDEARAAKVLERTQRKRALLLEHGAVSRRPWHFAPISEVVDELARLLALLGHDATRLWATVDARDTSATGPWSILGRIVPEFATQLLSARLRASPTLAHSIGAFVRSDLVEDDVREYAGEEWSVDFPVTQLPAQERADASSAMVFHEDDDRALLAVRTTEGTQIWSLARAAKTVARLGTVATYLRSEIDAWSAAEARGRSSCAG